MADTHVVTGLVAKRSEIGGLIAHHQREIEQLRAHLLHLDACIKLFDPEYDLRTIADRGVRQRNKYFEHGEGHRLTLEALRELGGQGNAAQIVQVVMTRKGFNPEWQAGVLHCMDGIIRRAAKAGAIEVAGRDSHGKRWRLIDLPH